MVARDWSDTEGFNSLKKESHVVANFGTRVPTLIDRKHDLPSFIRRFAQGIPVSFGLKSGRTQEFLAAGTDFLYVDNSYFLRKWTANKNFRLVRNGIHLTRVIEHEHNRLAKFNIVLKDWRANGSHVVVIEPSQYMRQIYGLPDDIAEQQAEAVKQYTDREIVIKRGKEGLPEVLVDAWACICPVSVAGVEAAVEGIPVFSTPNCPSWPISAGELKDIETPTLLDRYKWVNSLAWSSFNEYEAHLIDYRNYQCE